jgi:5'-3' exonuclease
MNPCFLVLDANYLCHRAKYTTGDLSIDDIPTGVIYGFLRDIITFTEKFDTTNIIFCWDSKTSKRWQIDHNYKQNRRDKKQTEEELKYDNSFREQIKKLRKIYLKQIGCANVFCQKGYESDDIIASVCKNLPEDNQVVIITADHDLYQCIKPNVSIYSPQKRKTLTLQGFKKQYGILPRDWFAVKALAGCTSDNIKGCKGVGEKTAIKYILGTINKNSKIFEKLCNYNQSTEYGNNCKLVTLPFEGTKKFKLRENRFSNDGWVKVCKELGIKSMQKRSPLTKKDMKGRLK